jgi:hypothetical protein
MLVPDGDLLDTSNQRTFLGEATAQGRCIAFRFRPFTLPRSSLSGAGVSFEVSRPTTERRSMETEEHLHVIGMGSEADWEAGRGSFYYIEDKNGEKCIPVFTSPERADRFAQANFDNPEVHMQMLESIGVVHAPALTSGRFIVMPLRAKGLARAAAMVEADYLVRDPRPGDQQDIMRVPK